MVAREMKPTLAHRPAIWWPDDETIVARSDTGAIRTFRADEVAAAERFAGVRPDRDVRVWRHRLAQGTAPQRAVFVLRRRPGRGRHLSLL